VKFSQNLAKKGKKNIPPACLIRTTLLFGPLELASLQWLDHEKVNSTGDKSIKGFISKKATVIKNYIIKKATVPKSS
jgi:hypothetical protein